MADSLNETYHFKDDDEGARAAMDDIDAFERRLNGDVPAKAVAARKPVSVPRNKPNPVASKKGVEYVKASVRAKPQKQDDDGYVVENDKDADRKAVSDLDRFDDGNLSD